MPTQLWLVKGMSLGDNFDLKDPKGDGGADRAPGMYLKSDEIIRHIEAGKQRFRLALSRQGQVDFAVDKDLSLRRIRFNYELKGINKVSHEGVLEHRGADCLSPEETLSTLQTVIAKTCGGISE